MWHEQGWRRAIPKMLQNNIWRWTIIIRLCREQKWNLKKNVWISNYLWSIAGRNIAHIEQVIVTWMKSILWYYWFQVGHRFKQTNLGLETAIKSRYWRHARDSGNFDCRPTSNHLRHFLKKKRKRNSDRILKKLWRLQQRSLSKCFQEYIAHL